MVGRFMAFDGGPGRVTRIRTLTPRSTCSTAMRRSDTCSKTSIHAVGESGGD